MLLISLVAARLLAGMFTVDAGAGIKYQIDIPYERVQSHADDIGLLARNMPGVVGIQRLSENRFLYQTQRSVPLGKDLKLDFTIERRMENGVTIYETADAKDPNYMRCAVRVVPLPRNRTGFDIRLRLRLSRESGSEVHWMAPIVGESFLSERMSEDLDDMLKEFRRRSSAELYEKLGRNTGPR